MVFCELSSDADIILSSKLSFFLDYKINVSDVLLFRERVYPISIHMILYLFLQVRIIDLVIIKCSA